MDLQAVRALAAGVAREAGTVLMHYYEQPHQLKTKRTVNDFATEADTAAEALIVSRLQAAFPDHHIVGEEGGGMGAPADRADYFWHVDPIDGTINYASGLPFFCVSLGLADRGLRPLVGVIYDPLSDELFSGARGHGASLNERPLQVSATDSLIEAMLCTGFPYDIATVADTNLPEWERFMKRSRGVRRFGSAALELAYVAAGRLDGFWEHRVNSWDVMAGLLLIEEAGGRISDYSGGQSDRLFRGQEVVASNGLLHETILRVLHEGANHETPVC